MLYAERHRPLGVCLAGAVHRTWAVAEKNDWQFSNPRIDTGGRGGRDGAEEREKPRPRESGVRQKGERAYIVLHVSLCPWKFKH